MPESPPCAFVADHHRPRFYRYRVADRALLRLALNRYVGRYGTATIGCGVVIGAHAYCVKWANARVENLQTGDHT